MGHNFITHQGIWQFGREYGVMYHNDTHATGSVDCQFYREMIKLNAATKEFLYNDYTILSPNDQDYKRPYLYDIVTRLRSDSDRQTVRNIVTYCRNIVEKCNIKSKDMIFGGTEEEIIERGTYWCTDIARVACILCQLAGFPSRIVITANTSFAYCGHTVVETHYENNWGIIDPTNGFAYLLDDQTPASALDVSQNSNIVNTAFQNKYGSSKDFFSPGEQYESICIVNYYANKNNRYDYTKSSLNDYVAGVLTNSQNKWANGLRWIYSEDQASLSIRKATKEDLPQILELEQFWEFEDITHGLVCGSENDLFPFLDYSFIALWHGIAVGYIIGRVQESKDLCVFEDKKSYLEIEEIYVCPTFRGENIGSMLLNQIIEKAKDQGIKRYKVYSATKDMEAIVKFYRNKGFKPWYVVMYRQEE